MRRMRRQRVLDHYGICVSAASIVSEAVPELEANVLSRVIADRGALEELTINAQAKAKSPGHICVNKVRVTLPLSVSLGSIDFTISFTLHTAIAKCIRAC